MPSLNVIYSPDYRKYDFGPGHPFVSDRADRFMELLKGSNMDYVVKEPQPATDNDILLAHTQKYLDKVKELARKDGSLTLDTPINDSILSAAYLYTGGTEIALRQALAGERVINLLGGLHHAESNDASGFCIFNDHAIAIRKLQQEGAIGQAIIYDVDVHAGNGTQEIFYEDPSVFNISLHQDPATLYPGTGFSHQTGSGRGEGYTRNIIFPPGTTEEEYLPQLYEALELADDYTYDLAILILGVDTFKEDPLASFEFEEGAYYKIGQRFRGFENLAVLCAGGYSQQIPRLWQSFLQGLVES